MKTTLHLHRPAPPAARSRMRPSIVRLGLVVSAIAAVMAVGLKAAVDVPAVLILVPVVVIGSALSWHASGRPEQASPD